MKKNVTDPSGKTGSFTNVTNCEVSHIKRFMSIARGNIMSSFTLNDDMILLKRVSMICYEFLGNKINIKSTQEIIDGVLIEENLPETPEDEQLILKFLAICSDQ